LHALLEDWGVEGFRENKKDFRAEAYVNVYQGHELFLTLLREKKPTQYHEVMSGLYNAIVWVLFTFLFRQHLQSQSQSSKGKQSATHIANTAMARLDLPVEDWLSLSRLEHYRVSNFYFFNLCHIYEVDSKAQKENILKKKHIADIFSVHLFNIYVNTCYEYTITSTPI